MSDDDSRRPSNEGIQELLRKVVGPRSVPEGRAHLPDLHGKRVRARVEKVEPFFDRRWGRAEIHAYWRLLEGPHEGALVWQKLNAYPGEERSGSHEYRWHVALCGKPEAGAQWSPEDWVGLEAFIWLRGNTGEEDYTLVDSARMPKPVTQKPQPEPATQRPPPGGPYQNPEGPNPSPNPEPGTQHPHPVPSTHTQLSVRGKSESSEGQDGEAEEGNQATPPVTADEIRWG